MVKTHRRRRHSRRGGLKNATLKAEKEALKAQKKAEAQILKFMREQKKAEKKEETQILKDVRAQKKAEKMEEDQILKDVRAQKKEERKKLKAVRTRKKKEKAQSKEMTEAEANKFEMLAMELFKKNSKMKAEAKEALYKMGRDHKDKESIDIMLENMWHGLDENEMAVWINKVRAKN